MKKRLVSLTLALGLLSSLATGCTPSTAQQSPTPSQTPTAPSQVAFTYADTIAWDGEYDVIVVGFGGAGAASAAYAAKAGASVLIAEKAPEGEAGGNSKVCGQLTAAASDYDKTMAYYKALYGEFDIPAAVLETYVQGLLGVRDQLKNDFNAAMTISGREHPVAKHAIPEYPELEGSEQIDMVLVSETMSNAALYNTLRSGVTSQSDKIDVWYEAPGKHLIQDPASKTILGVQIEKQGKPLNIRAQNGVVLACGGFENNPQMWKDYLSVPEIAVAGSFYNTGDGITMALEVGADLWHMNVWETSGCYGGTTFVPPEGEHTVSLTSNSKYNNGSLMMVSGDGTRFLSEDFASRHGHIPYGDSWHMTSYPERMFLIFDQAQYDAFLEKKAIPEKYLEQIVTADTVEALAEKLETANLATQVAQYNTFAETGIDVQYRRSAESMKVFTGGPYHAMRMLPRMLNTQGGPRRNENAQILDTEGNPIPNLYSAGELGGITANLYQGGGNMAECLIFGKIAGTNAAAPKEPLPALILAPTKAELTYTLGNDPDVAEAPTYALSENEYLGVGEGGMGGKITVKVRMDGDKIAAVEILDHAETKGICESALEQMPQRIEAAQSADVDAVAGATMTSTGIINAVKDALTQK